MTLSFIVAVVIAGGHEEMGRGVHGQVQESLAIVDDLRRVRFMPTVDFYLQPVGLNVCSSHFHH